MQERPKGKPAQRCPLVTCLPFWISGSNFYQEDFVSRAVLVPPSQELFWFLCLKSRSGSCVFHFGSVAASRICAWTAQWRRPSVSISSKSSMQTPPLTSFCSQPTVSCIPLPTPPSSFPPPPLPSPLSPTSGVMMEPLAAAPSPSPALPPLPFWFANHIVAL